MTMFGRRMESQVMRWVAIFEDNLDGGALHIRHEHAEAHPAYLAENRHSILLAGGLRSEPDEWYCGSLWVIEVDSRNDAAALLRKRSIFSIWIAQELLALRLGQGALLSRSASVVETGAACAPNGRQNRAL
jgi:hypothetical protein